MTTLFSRAFRKVKSSFAKMSVKSRLIPVFRFLTPVSHGDLPSVRKANRYEQRKIDGKDIAVYKKS